MSASSDERKRIEEKLPHELLKELYLNSRVSIKELERKLGISHHTLSKCLKECEKKYDLRYTLDVDMGLLGFSEPRLIAVKFQDRVPDIALLKKVFGSDPVVQDAYLSSGDFDLLLIVIGQNNVDYEHWEFIFRIGFSRYKPQVKTSTLNHFMEGFIPINSKLIRLSSEIDKGERIILERLIENSRIRIKDLSRETKLSESRVIYIINNLKEKGIIRKFTACVQNPVNRILLFYSVVLFIGGDHHPDLLPSFLNKIINEEPINQITTSYSTVCDTSGAFDCIYFCNFSNGTILNERGPAFLKNAWKKEEPKTEQCLLTELIAGKWPFNTNSYVNWNAALEKIINKPVKFKVYD